MATSKEQKTDEVTPEVTQTVDSEKPTEQVMADKPAPLAVITRKMLLSNRRYAPGQEWLKEAAEAGADKQVAKIIADFSEPEQAVIVKYLGAVS